MCKASCCCFLGCAGWRRTLPLQRAPSDEWTGTSPHPLTSSGPEELPGCFVEGSSRGEEDSGGGISQHRQWRATFQGGGTKCREEAGIRQHKTWWGHCLGWGPGSTGPLLLCSLRCLVPGGHREIPPDIPLPKEGAGHAGSCLARGMGKWAACTFLLFRQELSNPQPPSVPTGTV